VIVDAHPKEFIGVKLHQTVFLTGLDTYIGIVCLHFTKKALDKDIAPSMIIGRTYYTCVGPVNVIFNAHK